MLAAPKEPQGSVDHDLPHLGPCTCIGCMCRVLQSNSFFGLPHHLVCFGSSVLHAAFMLQNFARLALLILILLWKQLFACCIRVAEVCISNWLQAFCVNLSLRTLIPKPPQASDNVCIDVCMRVYTHIDVYQQLWRRSTSSCTLRLTRTRMFHSGGLLC